MKKVFKIIGIVLGSIVGLVLLLYAVLWIINAAMYGESRQLREYVCDVPEIHSGYAPQGIAYAKQGDREMYLCTGYDNDNYSVLYISENGESRRVRLAGDKDDELKGHAGGIACTKDFVYIANSSKLHVYSLSALVNADGDTVVPRITVINVDNNASFCHSDDDFLYVGEFYRPGNYETDESHHIETPNGDRNTAIVSCYRLNALGLIALPYPEYCISVTGLVQGFAVHNGTYMLSRSYGLSNSYIEYYSAPKPTGNFLMTKPRNSELPELPVPLFYLDSSNMIKSLTLPSFSEDLTIAGDRLVVTNESACNKYFIGKLFGAWKVYSFPVFSEE